MYIKNPKTHKRIFLDNSITDYQVRYAEVITNILMDDSIMDYLNNNNIIKGKSQGLSYENAERILENCATYLLLGQYKVNNIMTIYKIRRASVMELPISSLESSNAEDLMYSTASSPENISVNATPDILDKSFEKDIYNMSNNEINNKRKSQKARTKKYKNTKAFRLEKIYSTDAIRTYRVRQLIDSDKKPLKNVFGQPILDAMYITIGGHEGIIDPNKKYYAEWCAIDTDNVFSFMGEKYKVDESVQQYSVGDDNQCDMDQILCYYRPDKNEYYFFDQEIFQIDNELIEKI